MIKSLRRWAFDSIPHDLSRPLFIFRMNEHFRSSRLRCLDSVGDFVFPKCHANGVEHEDIAARPNKEFKVLRVLAVIFGS